MDASPHVPIDESKVDKTLRFVKKPIEIMDRDVKGLKFGEIALVKVWWDSKRGPEFTWEREESEVINVCFVCIHYMWCFLRLPFGFSLVRGYHTYL